jgi:hypothetical protein
MSSSPTRISPFGASIVGPGRDEDEAGAVGLRNTNAVVTAISGPEIPLVCWIEAGQHARLGAKHVITLKSNIVQHRRIGSICSEAFIPFR